MVGESAVQASAAVTLGTRDVLTREPEKETADREEKLPSAVVQEINVDAR